jgi:hypothetical protein
MKWLSTYFSQEYGQQVKNLVHLSSWISSFCPNLNGLPSMSEDILRARSAVINT